MSSLQSQHMSSEEREVQVLMMQQQLEASIHRVTAACWPKCVTYTDSSLSYKQEECLSNCTDRFLDTTILLTQKLNQHLQSS